MARVLIVDDNLLVRTLLRDILEAEQHVIAGEAQDGIDALALFHETRPDVVILNLVMPRRDGLTTLEELTKMGASVPVVICSATVTRTKVVRALMLGAKGFIPKPFDRRCVIDTVNAVVHRTDDAPAMPLGAHRPIVPQETPEREERRSFPRVEVELPITVTTAAGVSITTRTINVSGGGLLLAANPLETDAVVEFSLDLGSNERPITGGARAVRPGARTQQALAFERIAVDDHERLVRYLARVRADGSARSAYQRRAS